MSGDLTPSGVPLLCCYTLSTLSKSFSLDQTYCLNPFLWACALWYSVLFLATQGTKVCVLHCLVAELEPNKLAKFLRRVEDGYNDTPYHSKAHAADVLQSMHTLLTLGGLASRMDDELVMLAGQPPHFASSCLAVVLLACFQFVHPLTLAPLHRAPPPLVPRPHVPRPPH